MRRGLWMTVGGLLACGGEDAPEPAELMLRVPAAVTVAPRCADPVVRLYRDGEFFSCIVATATPHDGGAPLSVISCPTSKGLRSATPYQLEAVYLQGSQVLARAAVLPAPTRLQPGRNDLEVPLERVDRALDVNANGTSDLEETCP